MAKKLRIPGIGQTAGFGNLPDRYRMSAERSEFRDFLPHFKLPKVGGQAIKMAKPAAYQFGGVVEEPGLAVVHQGERVLTPEEQAQSDLPPVRQSSDVQIPDNSTMSNVTIDNDTLENLKNLLNKQPLKKDYKPSTTRKVVSALAGGATGFAHGPEEGAKAAESVYYAPFNRQYEDWLNQVGAQEKVSGLETGRIGAQNRGLTALAGLMRTQNAANPALQGEIAGARTAAQTDAKGGATPLLQNYNYYKNLPGNEQKNFQSFLTSIHPATSGGRENISGSGLSAADAQYLAQTEGMEFKDKAGNPIDVNKLQPQMGLALISSAPGDQRYAINTQHTATFTANNVTSRIPVLAPGSPIVSGVAKPPVSSTTVREEPALDANNQPIAQKLENTTATQTQTGPLPSPVNPGSPQNPQVLPPGTALPPTTNITPQVQRPGQLPQTQPPISQPPISQAPVTQAPRNNTSLNTTRPLPGWSQESLNQQNSYLTPSLAGMVNVVGKAEDPGYKSLIDYSDLAGDKKIGDALRLTVDHLASTGESADTIGATLMGFGASGGGGGFIQFLKNDTGLTAKMASAQNKVISDAYEALNPRERDLFNKILAVYGDVSTFRAVLKTAAYKWASDDMKNEIPLPGVNVQNPRDYFSKIDSFISPITENVVKRGNLIPDARVPERPFWQKRIKDISDYASGSKPTPEFEKPYTVEKVKR